MKTPKELIDKLRGQLHDHNYKYYILSQPEISDFEFDSLMKQLADLENEHPEYDDPNSPTKRVGSDINTSFRQVAHRLFTKMDNWYKPLRVAMAGKEMMLLIMYEPLAVCHCF